MLSVLLIDDEPALLEVLKLFSERSREMSVHTAQSATEALKILPEKTFDAIIVDYDMPELNGIEFLKILRSEGDTTPVIIFTGVGHEHTAIEAINNGANFFLQKGEDPQMQFRELVSMVKTAVERTYMGRNLGTTKRILHDLINFSSDPSFAIDREGVVVAWNPPMEQLTDVKAGDIIGKGDYAYAEPFFGTRRKMLINLIFESDDAIKQQKYMIVSRVPKGPIIAVTKATKKDGSDWTIWTKAMPVYDGQGNFIAAAGMLRDVTATFKDVIIRDESQDAAANLAAEVASKKSSKPAGKMFDKILGKATALYKEGVVLYIREKKYSEAIAAFDKALEIDEKLPHVWNDRGLCFREMGDNISALKSLLRAVELAPEDPELLFNLAETLEMIGVLYMSNKYLESAIQTFKMVANQMPNNAGVWNHIGICYKEMGHPEEAKFNFDRARDIHLWKKDTPIVPKRDEFLK
ncbi:MAG TPA: response regulator [Methanoregula sp.]|nr:response regulator [Methanoregula sp.]